MINEKEHLSICFIGYESGKSSLLYYLLQGFGQLSFEYHKALFRSDRANYNPSNTILSGNNSKKLVEGLKSNTNMTIFEISTDKFNFTLIDTPGRKFYIKNLIAGCSIADIAIFVVTANSKEFFIRNSRFGVTLNYPSLANVMGAKLNIICLSKIDDLFIDFSETMFKEIQIEVSKQLNKLGCNIDNVIFIPISSYKKLNIFNSSPELSWYKGPTLIEALYSLSIPERYSEKPLRVVVINVFDISGSVVIGGRIVSGTLRVGQTVIITPSGVITHVESIEINHKRIEVAKDGDIIGFKLFDIYGYKVKRGFIVSDFKNNPSKECECFVAEVEILQHPNIIKVGYTPVANIHNAYIPCRFEILQKRFDKKTGAIIENHPEFLKNGDSAIVVLYPLKPLCVETYVEYPKLGSFIITDLGLYIANGRVREILIKD